MQKINSSKKNHYVGFGAFIIVLFLGIISPVKANQEYVNKLGIVMTPTEYQTLLNLGFSTDEIYHMPKEIFEENKDLVATSLISRTQKYYKTVIPTYGNSYVVEVTENEYYNHNNNLLSTVETYYHTIVGTIAANGSLYRYKEVMYWNSLPQVKSYDVIALGFNGYVHIQGLSSFYNMYTDSGDNDYYSTNYFDKEYSDTGGTTTYELPSNFVGATAVYYFDVAKDTGAGTITTLSMCADYAHSLQTVTGLQAASHDISILGIDFAASVIGYFSEIPCADTYANVNW